MMKNFLAMMALVGILLGNVDAYGYFPYQEEDNNLSTEYIIMIVVLVVLAVATIGLAAYFGYQMEIGDESLPAGMKYMTTAVWVVATIVCLTCGYIGCAIMYLFVKSEQNKIKMHVNVSPYDRMPPLAHQVNTNENSL